MCNMNIRFTVPSHDVTQRKVGLNSTEWWKHVGLNRLWNKDVSNLTGERKADVQGYKMKWKYRPYGDTDLKRRLYTQTSPRRSSGLWIFLKQERYYGFQSMTLQNKKDNVIGGVKIITQLSLLGLKISDNWWVNRYRRFGGACCLCPLSLTRWRDFEDWKLSLPATPL